MIRRVNDILLDTIITEADSWVLCAWITPQSIPCSHFRPEFEGLQAACPDDFVFLEIDAGEHPEFAEYMKIQAVPTMVVYRKLEEQARFEGPYSRERLLQDITALVNGKRRRKK